MTRKEAIDKNLKVYDGDPCLKCGSTTRYVSSWSCKPCNLLKLENNRLMAPYRTKEKQRLKLFNWRKNNPEKVHEQYLRSDKGKVNAKAAKRRAKIRLQLPQDADLIKIIKVYKEAKELSIKTGIPHEVDHIVAIANGGLHHENNLQILTRTENRRKGKY